MNKNLKTSLSLRKLMLSVLVAAPLATLPSPLWALPGTQTALDGVVAAKSSGTTVSLTTADTVTVTTGTNYSWVKWSDFGSGVMTIASGENVSFNQPSTSSAVLNLITGTNPSSISGNINSNGQVFIVNPNGITATSTATFNTAGLTLSTLPGESEAIFSITGALSASGTPTAAIAFNSASATVGSTGTVSLFAKSADVSGTISAGTLNITTKAGDVRLGVTGTLTVGATGNPGYGNVTIATGGGNVDLANANSTLIRGSSVSIATGNGTISQTGSTVTVGDNNNSSTLNLTAGTGSITLSDVRGQNNKDINVTVVSGNNVSLTSAGGSSNIKLNASTIGGNLSVTSLGNISSGGTLSVTGNIALTANGTDKAITYVGAGDLVFTTLSATGSTKSSVTVTSTTGNVTVPTIAMNASGGTVSVKAQNNIIQSAAQVNSRTSTYEAVTGNITLTTATNDFGTIVLKGGPGGVTVVDANAIIVGNATNVTGDAKITATTNGITLGSASADSLTFNGKLYLTAVDAGTAANGTVTGSSDNVNVVGALNLNTSGAVTLRGSTNTSVGNNNRFGQVNTLTLADAAGSVAGLTIYESTTLNLGAITLSAGNLVAYSATGIVNTGLLTVPGQTFVGAGTATTLGDVSLNYTTSGGAGNALTGQVNVIDDVSLLSNTVVTPSAVGNYLVNNLTVVSQNNLSLNAAKNIYNAGLSGNVSLTTTGAANIANAGLPIYSTGTLNLTTNTGSITVTNAGNALKNVNVTAAPAAAGTVTVSSASANAVTVSATLSGGSNATTSFTSADALTLGAYTSNLTGLTTLTSGNKKAITDSVAGISIYGAVTFASNGAITINRAGHNFGGLTINTGNDNSATLVESGTLKLVGASTGKGSLTLTSTNGDIIQDAASTGIILANNSGANSANFSALKGAVVINDPGALNSLDKAIITLSALNDSTIKQGLKDSVLGNITVGAGKLIVDGAGAAISQSSGAKISVYGDTTFQTTGAKDIKIGNSGNNFGGLTVTTGAGNVTLTESGTVNILSLLSTGVVAVTSENGDIIDSVRSSGVTSNFIAGSTANTTTALGNATFTASKGNVTLALSGSNFGSVGFTTAGNVSVTDNYGDTDLRSSNVSGKFDLLNTAGNITEANSAGLIISGDTTFTASAGASSVSLPGTNQFGALKFLVGSGGAVINETTTMNLRAGTVATGPVNLTTGGNFITSGSGASSFLSNTGAVGTGLTITAVGTITPGAGSLLVINGLTVFSPSTKDLSLLSKSGNLAGKDPINLGTGTYVPPSP